MLVVGITTSGDVTKKSDTQKKLPKSQTSILENNFRAHTLS